MDNISGLTIKLIILLIPGLISYFIYKRITSRQTKRSDLTFIAISILLGILSYSFLQVLNYKIAFFQYDDLKTFESLSNEKIIPYKEVIWASFFGVIIAFIFTYIDSYNWVNNIARYIKATKKRDDANLFQVYLTSEIEWVYIRDIKNLLTYFGWVSDFAEKEAGKEIVLRDVIVYSYPDARKLYEIKSIYLNFGNEDIIIEQAN